MISGACGSAPPTSTKATEVCGGHQRPRLQKDVLKAEASPLFQSHNSSLPRNSDGVDRGEGHQTWPHYLAFPVMPDLPAALVSESASVLFRYGTMGTAPAYDPSAGRHVACVNKRNETRNVGLGSSTLGKYSMKTRSHRQSTLGETSTG